MIKKLKTSFAFTKNILVTGAVTETSKKSSIEICKYIPKGNNKVIVEFGIGHGNITREILKNMSPNSKLYAFEVKKSFCDHVQKNINDDRLIIINDGAENIKAHVKENVNAIIGSIPFSFFSKEKSLEIIQSAYNKLVKNGYYSQVLYTKFNFKKFQQVFEKCEIIKIKNTPTEFVYHCKKEIK